MHQQKCVYECMYILGIYVCRRKYIDILRYIFIYATTITFYKYSLIRSYSDMHVI
jgi:hypothetical protein